MFTDDDTLMYEEPEDIDILLAKAFAGEASPEEIALIDDWRKRDPNNEIAYFRSKQLMESLSAEQFQPKVDLAWKKLGDKIQLEETKVIPLFSRPAFFRAAAAILILIGGVLLYNSLRQDAEVKPVLIAAGPAPKEQKLSDGSTVVIASKSKLEFSKDKHGQRIAKLTGEAFFEVVHNVEEPFIVQTGEVLIKDIGTAFNVKTIPGSGNTEVFVESGEVQFYTNDSQGLKLVAGERGVYDKMSGAFTKSLVQGLQNLNSFRTRNFAFRQSRLGDVLDQVNMVYGSHLVTSNPSLNNCRLTVAFNNEPIEVIVDVITETLDLHAKRSGDTLVLTGKGCND